MGKVDTTILSVSDITNVLVSRQFKWNESEEEKILFNINEIGIFKFLELVKYKDNIDEVVNLFIADMRLSRFLWRHVRRIESKFKAVLINYFYMQGDPNLFDQKGSLNKEVIAKYTKYIKEDDINGEDKNAILKVNKSIISKINRLSNNYYSKKQGKKIIKFIEHLSLGNLVNFSVLLSLSDEKTNQDIENFYQTKSLVKLRNEISHFHLLINNFTKEDLESFWKIMMSMSDSGDKETKNYKEFKSLLMEYHL